MVIAVIPALGRFPLLTHTVDRLYNRNGVDHVIIVGGREEKEFCRGTRAEFVAFRNNPLGSKWNAGFLAARAHKPDACLFVGSSDWISDNWLSIMMPYTAEYDLVGTPGCYFMHLTGGEPMACEWAGYIGRRADESIGIGRLISARILDRIGWQPFDWWLERSLDYSMQEKCIKAAGKLHLVRTPELKSVSISTDRWPNKHQFSDHYNGKLKSKIINEPGKWADRHFPEWRQVFNQYSHETAENGDSFGQIRI